MEVSSAIRCPFCSQEILGSNPEHSISILRRFLVSSHSPLQAYPEIFIRWILNYEIGKIWRQISWNLSSRTEENYENPRFKIYDFSAENLSGKLVNMSTGYLKVYISWDFQEREIDWIWCRKLNFSFNAFYCCFSLEGSFRLRKIPHSFLISPYLFTEYRIILQDGVKVKWNIYFGMHMDW